MSTCPSTPLNKILRPNNNPEVGVTFYWYPGKVILELIYDQTDGIQFAIWEYSKGVYYDKQYPPEGYQPLLSLAPLTRSNTLRLPSEAIEYGSISQLAEKVRRFIHRYFDCDPQFESVAVAFIIHTWVYECFHAVPYMRFCGMLGSGKSRGTETIGSLCYRPVSISGVATAPALFRTIESVAGTVLFDEADFQNTAIGADIVKILNQGYQKNLPIIRNEARSSGGGFDLAVFEVFGPKIISGRKKFRDEATESRCLMYSPVQTKREDIPYQLPAEFEQEALEIRNQALMFRFRNLDTFKASTDRHPELSPRMNQILQPLIAVADAVDEDLRARKIVGRSYRKDVLEFAKVQDQKAKEEQKTSVEFFLLEAFLDCKGETAPLVSELAKAVIKKHKADDPKMEHWLSPKRAGIILREMGFETPHTNKGSKVSIAPEKLASLKKRFGIAG